MSAFLKDNSLLLLLAVATACSGLWLRRHREMLRVSIVWAWLLALFHTLIGVLCVKIFVVMETLDFSNFSGMSLFGAVFFLPLVYWAGAKLSRRNAANVFDVFTPCVVFTLMCARINCILSGCCLGRYIPGQAPMRWPTREIEVVFYLLLTLWLIRRDGKKGVPGTRYPIYMVSYGALRFVLEFFRVADTTAAFHIAHLWSVICFGLGLSFYYELTNKPKKMKEREK